MPKIEVEVKVVKTVDIEIEIEDVIEAINECEMPKRWNHIGAILNNVELSISELNEEKRSIIKNYLKSKLSLFETL